MDLSDDEKLAPVALLKHTIEDDPLPPVTRRFARQARSPTAGVAEPIAPGSPSWPEVARSHRHLRAKARHGIGRIHLPSR